MMANVVTTHAQTLRTMYLFVPAIWGHVACDLVVPEYGSSSSLDGLDEVEDVMPDDSLAQEAAGDPRPTVAAPRPEQHLASAPLPSTGERVPGCVTALRSTAQTPASAVQVAPGGATSGSQKYKCPCCDNSYARRGFTKHFRSKHGGPNAAVPVFNGGGWDQPPAATAAADNPAVPPQPPIPAGHPDFAALLAWAAEQEPLQPSPAPLRRKLTRKQQASWRATCGRVLSRLAAHPDDKGAGWAFMSLPRLCLPAGDGERHSECDPRKLCRRFDEGDWAALLHEALARDEASPPLSGAGRCPYRSVAQLVEAGEFSRGMARLANPASMAPSTAATLAALQLLHPETGGLTDEQRAAYEAMLARARADAAGPGAARSGVAGSSEADGSDLQSDDATAVPIELDIDVLQAAIMSSPRHSASGPSGWTFEHLRYLAAEPGALLMQLHGFLVHVARGTLPRALAAAMGACNLIALAKDGGGVRPIAVGEVLRRATARALCRQLAGDMDSFFQPIQYGVQARGGAESASHAVDVHLGLNPGHVAVKADCRNAFNSVDRASIFAGLVGPDAPSWGPSLLGIVQMLYGDATTLYALKAGAPWATLRSVAGTQQGDPLASCLFCLALHPCLTKVQRAFAAEGLMVIAYADDVNLVGAPSVVADAFDMLRTELELIGLALAPSKCCAWAPSGELGPLANHPGFEAPAPEGFMLLGVWLGPHAEVARRCLAAVTDESLPKSVARKVAALGALSRAGYGQHALALLLSCVAPSVDHIYRVVHPDAAAGAAGAADGLMLEGFRSIAGITATELVPGSRQEQQLGLPLRLGGLGLRPQVARARTALLASYAATGPDIAGRWPHLADAVRALALPIDTADDGSHPLAALHSALAEQLSYVTETLELPAINFVQPVWGLQGKIAAAEAPRARGALTGSIPAADRLARAHWTSTQLDARVAFASACPSKFSLSANDLRFALRRLLRMPLRDCAGLRCSCGTMLDPYGDHVDVCPHLAGARTERHDYVNQIAVFGVAKRALLPAAHEPRGLVPGTLERPADTSISFGHGWDDGCVALLDVCAVGSATPAHVDANLAQPQGALGAAVRRKLARRCPASTVLIPLAFETQGGLHSNWRECYRRWGVRLEGISGLPASVFVRQATQTVSCAIQRAQARLTRKCLYAAARIDPRTGRVVSGWEPPDPAMPHRDVTCPA